VTNKASGQEGKLMSYWELGADIASIATAMVAVFGYGYYQLAKFRNCRSLERHLQCQKESGTDKGQRGLVHLMAKVGLTEAEIFEASRRSRHIVRRVKVNPATNLATDLLFEYQRNGNEN
jgi:biotin synthase-related radical SAM superfamily protein